MESTKLNKENKLKKYLDFYNKDIRKTHIVIYIICMVIFLIFVNTKISNVDITISLLDVSSIQDKSLISIIFKDKLLRVFLIIFAGITPFIYLPVTGIVSAYNLAVNISGLFNLHASSFKIVICCIGAIIQMFGFSLAIAVGIYYCRLATKKYRYNFGSGITFSDIKKTFYKSINNEEKLKKVVEKENEKMEKREKLNVKIPYIKFAIYGVISFIIVTLGTILCKF